jgi:multidrug efflux pump subunit AcrA (membrane-fusion protein)
MKRLLKHLRTFLLSFVVLAVTGLALYGGRRAWMSSSVPLLPLTMTVQPRDFKLIIPSSGELQSVESVTVAVPFVPVNRLRIASVVPDGRYVNKGDVLVEFDPAELELQVEEHRSSLEMAAQKINQGELAADVEKSDFVKDKRIAEMELEKITQFLPQDEEIYSRRQIIEGQLDKSYTEKKIVFADGRLQLKGKVYSLAEAILLLERQQATTKIGQAEKALASLKLLAPTSGIVSYNDPGAFFGGSRVMPGRVVWIGMTLFNLVNPDKMEAKCFVLERDAGELRVGQAATVTLDPFPGRVFTGKVKSIDKLARPIDRDSPVKYFQTIVSLDKTEPELMKPGVKLKADIVAGEMKAAVIVPRSAVVKKDGGFIVYIQKEANQFAPVPITLGQGDLAQVVVTEGLQPAQVLALNPPDVKREVSSEAKLAPSK